MIDIDEYGECGKRAAQARNHYNEMKFLFEQAWLKAALATEPDYRRHDCQNAYAKGFQSTRMNPFVKFITA